MNYTFEFVFIPSVVDNSNKDDITLDTCEIFDNFDLIECYFESNFPNESEDFNWNDLSIHKEINKKQMYWLMRFPSPQKEPEAKWGLIVKKADGPYRYITFELCHNGRFALCSFNNGRHMLHDFFDAGTTVEEFIDAACNMHSDNPFI